MPFRELNTVGCDNQTKHVNTLYIQNSECSPALTGLTYEYHLTSISQALHCQYLFTQFIYCCVGPRGFQVFEQCPLQSGETHDSSVVYPVAYLLGFVTCLWAVCRGAVWNKLRRKSVCQQKGNCANCWRSTL